MSQQDWLLMQRVAAGEEEAVAELYGHTFEFWRANILEENQAELSVDGDSVTFSVTPYEIVTLRLQPA